MKEIVYSFCFLLIIQSLAVFGLKAQNIPSKPNPAKFVNDFAQMLTDYDRSNLEAKLEAYNDSTSTQVVIVTIEDLQGASVEAFAFKIAETWGIGQKGKDNGLLILLVKNQRAIRIEVGYGLEARLPDLTAKRVIDEILIPRIRQNQLNIGLDLATTAIFRALSGEFVAETPPKPIYIPNTEDYWYFTGMVFLLGFFLMPAITGFLLSSFIYRKPNGYQKLFANFVGFALMHSLIAIYYFYFTYLLFVFLGDLMFALFSGALYLDSVEGKNSRKKSTWGSSSSSYSSSSYSDSSSSYSDSSSSYSDSSYSDSSSSYSDSSYGGGSFGGGGASGSW
jgi:uncharacterized protein